MILIENFLSKSYHKELLEILGGPNFDWYFSENISYKNKKNGRLNEYGFYHIFWDNNGKRNSEISNFWKPALLKIMDTVDCNNIVRSRADMTMNCSEEFIHDPHVDFFFPNISVVYYVNDSDGDTILYNEKYNDINLPVPKKLSIKEKISPKANRLIAFEGEVLHTGCSPVKHKNRIIINSNFEVLNND